MKLPAITAKYGPDGITELAVNPRVGIAEVTDDTQMVLFTAEECCGGSVARIAGVWAVPRARCHRHTGAGC
jgi:hypothetical protein